MFHYHFSDFVFSLIAKLLEKASLNNIIHRSEIDEALAFLRGVNFADLNSDEFIQFAYDCDDDNTHQFFIKASEMFDENCRMWYSLCSNVESNNLYYIFYLEALYTFSMQHNANESSNSDESSMAVFDTLVLNNNQIIDITPLSSITDLRTLVLNDTSMVSTPVSSMVSTPVSSMVSTPVSCELYTDSTCGFTLSVIEPGTIYRKCSHGHVFEAKFLEEWEKLSRKKNTCVFCCLENVGEELYKQI